jgi:hypothetical protein
MYVLYYASMLQHWHLVWILVRTDHPCLGVGFHKLRPQAKLTSCVVLHLEITPSSSFLYPHDSRKF